MSDALLRECLNTVAPLELAGTKLLRESGQPGTLFPGGLPREQVREAVAEVIAYTTRCTDAARRLSRLAPIPLSCEGIYGL